MADRDILSEDRIQDYIDDRLSQRDRASVAAYLLAHPEVGADVEALRRQNEALKALGQEILDEPLPHRLLDALHQAENEASPVRGRFSAVGVPRGRSFLEAAAAVLLFVVGGAAGWFLHGELNPFPSEDDLLTSQVVRAYSFYERDYPLEFTAERAQDFDGWISRAFERSVPPPDLARFNFIFSGGRMVPTSQRPIGHFQFENDREQRLGVFFWQASGQPWSQPVLSDDSQTALKIWVEGDLRLAVVSEPGNPDFDAIADDVSTFYRQALAAQ